MKRILDFKRRASDRGLCAEYTKMWNRALSKKELIDIATDANGVHFIADAISFGWGGIESSYISGEFAEYINGNYQRRDGYTSRLYCGYSGKVVADSTILLLVDCYCPVEVPKDIFCSVVIAGKSDVTIVGEGRINELTIYKDSLCKTEMTPRKESVKDKSMWDR